jgi:hypothetical protein
MSELKYARRVLSEGLKQIEAGAFPWMCHSDVPHVGDLVAPFHARCDAARDEYHRQLDEKLARLLKNDAAWEAELKWRAAWEAADRAREKAKGAINRA